MEICKFPYPTEVTGGSYKLIFHLYDFEANVSVPSRGNWGFLQKRLEEFRRLGILFPSPLEVTGVSYGVDDEIEHNNLSFRPLPR